MRKSTLILAFAASSALVVASAGTSLATSSSHSNSGASHTAKANPNFHAAKTTATKKFKAYANPAGKYLKSCNIDLSAIPDFTLQSSVSGCKTTVSLGGTFDKRSVPNSWGSWNSPPFSETATPNLLYSNGLFTTTIDFGKKVKTGGFEYEPDQFQVETVTVEFHAGANGSGAVVGTITRDVNGQSGSLLFGAHAKKGFKSAIVSNNSSDDFGIAQIRV